MNEKISILIPCFNREKYIQASINSILKQSYKNLDIIIYDDGSSDNSVKIIEDLLQEDSRIQLIKGDKNMGVGYARNKLLDACKTNFAVWQDSDDISHPNRINLLQKAMKQKYLIFSSWAWLHLTSNGWVAKLQNSHNKAFASLMFPVDKNIRFNDKIKLGGEDWDWIERMLLKYESISIPDRIYFVRFHADRIGVWKKKFRKRISKELLNKLSYQELIEYYKNNGSSKI